MNQLVREITRGLLEDSKRTIGVFGGGFKPPTKGHMQVIKQAIDENPDMDEVIIYVGKGERDGVTQEDSVKVWNIYQRYLPSNVKLIPSTKPPIQAIYNLAKENPEDEVLWVIGARDGSEDDFTDIAQRTKSMSKYPNLELRTIVTKGGISGTAARNALRTSKEKFDQYLPDYLTVDEKGEIYTILTNKVSEKQTLNEEASFSQYIDYKAKIDELTQHMLRKGMNITPLPKVIYAHDDEENAKDFFGKTAYYDPENLEIVLYTEGRHPKDIVRSFAHEMIHHIQNMEGRLGNVITTNTTEDEHLDKLEQEANLRGTMTFRNWTDGLNESIVGQKIVCDNCGWNWNIADGGDDMFTCHKCGSEDNQPIVKEKKTSDPFGLKAFTDEIVRLNEEEEQNYKIYVDMDGVVADFDKRFRDISGMAPKEFENKYGKKAFWDLIDEENKVKFWVGIPPMLGASELISFVSKHDYEMLTAPSIKKQSRLGKNLWIRNHTGDIFPSKPKVNFKFAKEKHLIKPQLTNFDILIDDRAATINNWNAAGGTGILYKSAPQVISKLKKLGL